MTKSIPKGYKQTEIGIIPEDWEVKKLGDVFEISAGGDLDKNIFSKTKTSKHKYPIYSNAVENEGLYGYSTEYKYPKNCITVTARGTLGYAIPRYKEFNAIIRLLVLQPKREVNIKYVAEYINNLINFSIESTGVPQLTAPQISKYKLSLPSTLKEQQAIARVLSDIDELIESLDKLIEKKKIIKKGAMQLLLTGKKRLPGFKGEWVRKKLGELGDCFAGGTPSTSNPSYWNGTIIWLQSGRIQNNIIKKQENEITITEKGLKNSAAKLIKKNSVLIAITGATCGNVGLLTFEASANQSVVAIEPYSSVINYKFLYYKLIIERVKILRLQNGSAQGGTNLNNLKTIKLFIPPTIEEQRAIAQILSDMDSEIEALEKKKEKYEQIKKGAMELLLTGKVRLLEKETSKEKHSDAFNEAVLISVLTDAFGSESYPLSRFRYTKLSYIFHRFTDNNIRDYQKMAAGPYNPKNRYKGPENIALKKRYIKQVKTKYEGFVADKNIDKAKEYFSKWYDSKVIDLIKDKFKFKKHEELEAITTIDYAILHLKKKNKDVNVDTIIEFLKNDKEWKNKLKREHFSKEQISKTMKFCLNIFNYEVLK